MFVTTHTDVLLSFSCFRFDPNNQCLWREGKMLPLRPKVFAVLQCLLAKAGQMVSKAELLKAGWPGTVVGDAVLTVCIQEIRELLGDNATTPRFIVTVHRRGYRFIAAITAVPSSEFRVPSSPPLPAPSPQRPAPTLVGRSPELQRMDACLTAALHGQRQLMFVSGEAGIGKTALIDTFVTHACEQHALRVIHGQCVEHHGAAEAYLPVLDAFGRLCRNPREARVVDILRRFAPTWLMQMPWLLSNAEREALQREPRTVTRERMLREMAEALEALTEEAPLVCILEDLHWSDSATLDLLSVLARRREPARLLILGSYRPVEVTSQDHPLRAITRDLQQRNHGKEISLDLLSREAVEQYVAACVGEHGLHPTPLVDARALATVLYRCTEGNPLFLVKLIEELVARQALAQTAEQWEHTSAPDISAVIPHNIRQMVDQQLERLSPEQQKTLLTASVEGVEFSAITIATVLKEPADVVEDRCDDLGQRSTFLQAADAGEWPDGTLTARYRFTHALYRTILYERLTATQRVRIHLHIGTSIESAYEERASEKAAELAVHFELGRDYRRAVRYLWQSSTNALLRQANREAITALRKGLTLLARWPDPAERVPHELRMQLRYGQIVMALKGYASPDVEQAYGRARVLCQRIGETPKLFPAIAGLWGFHLVRAELTVAREFAEQLLRLASATQETDKLVDAHFMLGCTLLYLGEFPSARRHFEAGKALHAAPSHYWYASLAVQDPTVACLPYGAFTLWFMGYPDQAVEWNSTASARARGLAHPFSLVFSVDMAATLHYSRGEVQEARQQAETLLTLARDQEFALWEGTAMMTLGWALTRQGQETDGLHQMEQGLAAFRATGAQVSQTMYLTMFAESCGRKHEFSRGLALLDEALAAVHRTGEHFYEAEIYRVKGELMLQQQFKLMLRSFLKALLRIDN
jgi:DNA-binding winged helix-turn-helix (wHTH) protein/predicted ATPase